VFSRHPSETKIPVQYVDHICFGNRLPSASVSPSFDLSAAGHRGIRQRAEEIPQGFVTLSAIAVVKPASWGD
jgi:hypothetical protein